VCGGGPVFGIKICGITSPDDARAAIAAGADAVGLNFHPASPRYVELDRARQIVAQLPASVARVGVFVNSPVPAMIQAHELLRLDFLQLHGDEPPEVVAHLAGHAVVRAFRFQAGSVPPIAAYLESCQRLGQCPSAVLIDAYEPDRYGGTGRTADWTAVRDRPPSWSGIPWILAGGLTPANVGLAIAQARPDAVDVASGVESQPGCKDADRCAQFVRRAREAFAALS